MCVNALQNMQTIFFGMGIRQGAVLCPWKFHLMQRFRFSVVMFSIQINVRIFGIVLGGRRR